MSGPEDARPRGPVEPPVPLGPTAEETTAHWRGEPGYPDPPEGLQALAEALPGRVHRDGAARRSASRDWSPLALHWARRGEVPALASAVVRPESAAEVALALRLATQARLPVTPSGGRSGVCGGAVPWPGGLALETSQMSGLVDIDEVSLRARVKAGTFGPELEAALAPFGLTAGHWPQSHELSTVGGWVACRSAGQLSNRYGKIEDRVSGLEVALASGSLIRLGDLGPGAATGPDLAQLFVGSEGVLGVLTEVTLRLDPKPEASWGRAFALRHFADALEVLRRLRRHGARPAVTRALDPEDASRSVGDALAGQSVLLVYDEASLEEVEASRRALERHLPSEAEDLGQEPVDAWLANRNDVSLLGPLVEAGLVVDTVEVSAPWTELAPLWSDARGRLGTLDGLVLASAHCSHAHPDGACLYFTVVVSPKSASVETTWQRAMEAVLGPTVERGGSVAHHHGIGRWRRGWFERSAPDALRLLGTLKAALDPAGILNPGVLGLGPDLLEGP